MATKKPVVFKSPYVPTPDAYQSSLTTQYVRDGTTGQLRDDTFKRIINTPFPTTDATLVYDSNTATGATNTLYTIQDGYTLYLLSYTLQTITLTANNNFSGIRIGPAVYIVSSYGTGAANIGTTTNYVYTTPLILVGPLVLYVHADANIKSNANFVGYLLPNNKVAYY